MSLQSNYRTAIVLVTIVFATCAHDSATAVDSPATFFRGLNLNGPAVTVDGNRWEGQDAKNYVCIDKAFDSQQVNLVPPTEPDRAKMIRSSRWGGNRVELTGIPNGVFTVFLYVWEDNNAESYDVQVNGREVLRRYNSGSKGHWERLGPWKTDVTNEQIVLTSTGGAANFSGIEVWRGDHDGHVTIPEDQLAFFEKRVRPLLIHGQRTSMLLQRKDVGEELGV